MKQFERTTQNIDLDKLRELNSFKDMVKYKTNPFTKDFEYNKKVYYDKVADRIENSTPIEEETKERVNNFLEDKELILAKELYKDTTNFCKLFIDQKILDINNLNGNDSKLFLYILFTTLNANVDFIILNPKVLSEKLNMSINTIYSCIVNLNKNLVITQKEDDNVIYWINPYIFFRGDRKKIRFRKI